MIETSNFPAFPLSVGGNAHYPGLTKREYLASLAMQGILASGKYGAAPKILAERALECADALLQELGKEIAA